MTKEYNDNTCSYDLGNVTFPNLVLKWMKPPAKLLRPQNDRIFYIVLSTVPYIRLIQPITCQRTRVVDIRNSNFDITGPYWSQSIGRQVQGWLQTSACFLLNAFAYRYFKASFYLMTPITMADEISGNLTPLWELTNYGSLVLLNLKLAEWWFTIYWTRVGKTSTRM